MRAGELVVEGGTIIGTGVPTDFKPDGSGTYVTSESTLVKFDYHTLYAIWDNATLNELPTPTREGYTFVEWQVNGKTFDFGTTLSEDITKTSAKASVPPFIASRLYSSSSISIVS